MSLTWTLEANEREKYIHSSDVIGQFRSESQIRGAGNEWVRLKIFSLIDCVVRISPAEKRLSQKRSTKVKLNAATTRMPAKTSALINAGKFTLWTCVLERNTPSELFQFSSQRFGFKSSSKIYFLVGISKGSWSFCWRPVIPLSLLHPGGSVSNWTVIVKLSSCHGIKPHLSSAD